MEFTRRRVSVQRVWPEVARGRYPAKAVAGDPVDVHADLVCDGHDVLRAVVRWRAEGEGDWRQAPLRLTVNDRWVGAFTPPEPGRYQFTVESWVDPVGTWRRDLVKKADADAVETVDLEVGAALLRDRASRSSGSAARRLEEFARAVVDPGLTLEAQLDAALGDELRALAVDADPREHKSTYDRVLDVHADRPRAAFSSWYELFPRSASPVEGRHGTLRDVIDRLDHVVELGFDVLYLPPIHPIGVSHRKGADNAVVAGPDDPGSPWAIGSAEGGHKSIHPQLGDFDDFAALRDACEAAGVELALDIAFQCSPDHPYVTEHPEWFRRRPDGTIQYAENPPKKYQDIYPFDFETSDPEGLWRELKSIFEFWIDRGVRIFRVDNPHTKSLPFWSWCIDSLTAEHPDLIFLSEAFTRPKVMHELAMRGFTQSYTYFTWRRHKWEIEEYYTELFQTDVADFLRPSSWPNTPDILTDQLQHGGRPMYVARLVLAATLTANYGMYGPAFELMWSEARPGAEEYAANEKYEIKTWDVDHPDSLREVIALVNSIRHRHPALQRDRSLKFHHVGNDQLLAYSKRDEATGDTILVVVNLDPGAEQAGTTWLDLAALGLEPSDEFHVHDLFGGGTYLWHGADNYVHLNPHVAPAHIFQVLAPHRTEVDFDQYQ
jgi:starch synthase (maltosyl-transferring)